MVSDEEFAEWRATVVAQEKDIVRLLAHAEATQFLIQSFAVVLQARGAISRDEIAVAFQANIVELTEAGRPPEVIEALLAFQRLLLQPLPLPENGSTPRSSN